MMMETATRPLVLVPLALVTALACAAKAPSSKPMTASQQPAAARHGALRVCGTRLCGAHGAPVQLRGMSTNGLQWQSEVLNDGAFVALARDWKADVVRLALYVGEGGYAAHPELEQSVVKGVDLAIRHGLYVIVDWHVLTPGNPNDPIYAGAQAFFDRMSKKYGGTPNVIYEIMNEPNGALSWSTDLKPYAEKMVSTIRANDPDNIILIGSGTWSQEVDVAAADPVQGTNLAYTFHFYAGTHGEPLRAKVRAALDLGVALFCSEWGTSEATGTGGLDLRESQRWLDFLDQHGIGWTNWSLCDKSESSAALLSLADALKRGRKALLERDTLLVPETRGPDGYPVWPLDELSPSGVFVREKMRSAAGR